MKTSKLLLAVLLAGSFGVASAGVLTNTIQAVMSVLVSMLLYTALRKIPFIANLSKQVQE